MFVFFKIVFFGHCSFPPLLALIDYTLITLSSHLRPFSLSSFGFVSSFGEYYLDDFNRAIFKSNTNELKCITKIYEKRDEV